MTRGLVIGKFYPFHNGHRYLIETAANTVDNLTILVGDGTRYNIPAETRANWIREVFPTITVGIIPEVPADDDSAGWAAHTHSFLGYVPDVVFTSEDYGDPFAAFLGSRHVLVDRQRVQVPCSGTMIRANPLAYFEYLPPPVRAYYAKRIAIIGVESTGKTTLARTLALHYETTWVPEYGRMYWEGKVIVYTASASISWNTAEFVHIARMQAAMENQLAKSANRLLVCDTDPFATSIWHRRYVGMESTEVRAIADDQSYALYLLMDHTLPFVQDGTRDGEQIRADMHAWFVSALEETNRPYVLLTGSYEERTQMANAEIDKLLAMSAIR